MGNNFFFFFCFCTIVHFEVDWLLVETKQIRAGCTKNGGGGGSDE